MKKILSALIVIALIAMSCESDNSTEKSTVAVERNLTLKSITFSPIGIKDATSGEFVLTASDASINKLAREFVKGSDENANLESYRIEKIDGKDYLRFVSDKNMVSTVAIEFDDKSQTFSTMGTVCTSRACADGGGCVPNGDYCTSCYPYPLQPTVKGDCSRTTSSDPGIEP